MFLTSYKKLESKVPNPDEGNSKVEGRRNVEVEAVDLKGITRELAFVNALHVPGYKTNLISVSNIVEKGTKLFISLTEVF